jgi:predicted permease
MTFFKVSTSVFLFIICLALGWWLGRRGVLTKPRATRLTNLLIKYPSPVVLCLTLWSVELSGRLWVLPVLGFVISASMLLPAWYVARSTRLSRPQTGSLLTCALFSNLGYIGAFTAFALYGEEAYGLCVLYFLFFGPTFYTLGFWIASRFGRRPGGLQSSARPVLEGESKFYPFGGMLLGILLNLLDVPRPAALTALNHVLIPVDTVLFLTAVGSQLMVVPLGRWLKPSLAMSAIKFLWAPAVAWICVSLLHLEGLPRFVVLLEASTPVAVSPLVFPLLFGLDRELSNALWFFTTLVSIPWLLLIVPVLQRL